MKRTQLVIAAAVLVALFGATALRAACTTTVNEASTPVVFTNMNTTDTGFASYYWAWGTSDASGVVDQDGDSAALVDSGSDIGVATGINWANSTRCSTNPLTTGLLLVSETASSGGKFALCVGSQNNGTNVDLDALQLSLSAAQSQASSIPSISINSAATGNDGNAYTEYSVTWSAPSSSAWAVNDQSGDVLAGYAIYYRTGSTSNTGNKTGWARLSGAASGTTPYVTNDGSTNTTTDGYLPTSQTGATIRVYGSDTYFFALALRFDGTGAPSGTDREAAVTAVETGVVGPSSNGAVGPLAAVLAEFAAVQAEMDSVELSWRTVSEENVMGFRISRTEDDTWRAVETVPAAGQAAAGATYTRTDQPVQVVRGMTYRLEVIGSDGSTIESREATVQLMNPGDTPLDGRGLENEWSGPRKEPGGR